MVVQCCVCRKVRVAGRWVSGEELVREQSGISHGYCPPCAAVAFEEIRALNRAEESVLVRTSKRATAKRAV